MNIYRIFSIASKIAGYSLALIILASQILNGATLPRNVKVGVYDNPPKIEYKNLDNPRGIFIDIIEHIAQRERWNITYVSGDWDSCLARLADGRIDIMPDVAYSESRAQQFDFSKLTVLASWLQVFQAKGLSIESISDLQGKTITVLESSIQKQACEEIREKFGLSFDIISAPDYESTISLVESGKADAMVVSRFYGFKKKINNTVFPTPVILYPTTLRFAVPKGKNQDIITAVDKHLAEMQSDTKSVFYHSLFRWLSEEPQMFIPSFLAWILAVLIIMLFFISATGIYLWLKVKKQAMYIEQKNSSLRIALKELKDAQDEAVKRERLYAFGQLACGIAHDFNNLLVPIVNYSDLLLQRPLEAQNLSDLQYNLSEIRIAAMHGVEIVRRMQNFYRFADKDELIDELDVNDSIKDVIELAKMRWKGQGFFRNKGIDIIFNKGEIPKLKGRKSSIHEAMLNIVLNAADALPDGGRIEINTSYSGNEISISVSDNGIGMTQEVREKCLQPFFTTKGSEGTGIGLAMVNAIVSEHKGRIEIDSEFGKGTRITVVFPHISSL